ncbi:hypothetical protein FACS189464_0310 [Bacteroidia bacterium]|nr:hypothetical protein FACS189464_0310 [Bacteroidia bacterium]
MVSLNGQWQVAKTEGELPKVFNATTPVPGVVDMAVPALDTAGYQYKDSSWYWHRRTFDLKGVNFDVIQLKIFKAKYHTKVYVNGQFAGENAFCFTPSYFDVKPFLKPAGQPNEIVIGVGSYMAVQDSVHNGSDGEKVRHIPGIYDRVEITLSNQPFINNVQCVPDIKTEKLRVVAEIETNNPAQLKLDCEVSELATGKKVTTSRISSVSKTGNGTAIVDFEIDMKGATLWTPETPFLYELALNTGKDSKRVRFGMRSFRFDTEKKIALLNEEPYYLRGTNVCILRFMEDAERGTLLWDDRWIQTMYERFKDFKWNINRFHVGFAPERFYEICDSIGFLVQDEYAIWHGLTKTSVAQLAEEYRRWMRERWNHPCVVIWDAQNETVTTKTGAAAKLVRHLDLSNRPWDNGYSTPIAPEDPAESHPYLFVQFHTDEPPMRPRLYADPEEGYKKYFFGKIRRPDNDASEKMLIKRNIDSLFSNPSINNEYGWIWLNRNGTTTTISDKVYKILWNQNNLTPQERFYLYARNLAMMTEYWRAHRLSAGVMEFCALTVCRPTYPRASTSDHWIDVPNLTFEPEFYKYMRPAFSPVGLMIDLWEKDYPAEAKITVPVYVINDLKPPFAQDVTLTLLKDDKIVSTWQQKVNVKPYQVEITPFEITLPKEAGDYLLKAEITVAGEQVFSIRDIPVKKL